MNKSPNDNVGGMKHQSEPVGLAAQNNPSILQALISSFSNEETEILRALRRTTKGIPTYYAQKFLIPGRGNTSPFMIEPIHHLPMRRVPDGWNGLAHAIRSGDFDFIRRVNEECYQDSLPRPNHFFAPYYLLQALVGQESAVFEAAINSLRNRVFGEAQFMVRVPAALYIFEAMYRVSDHRVILITSRENEEFSMELTDGGTIRCFLGQIENGKLILDVVPCASAEFFYDKPPACYALTYGGHAVCDAINDSSKPSVCLPSPTSREQTLSISELRKLLQISNTTLNKYARKAGLQTPKRGQRGFRYTVDQAICIAKTIREETTEKTVQEICDKAIIELKSKKDRKIK